MRFWDWVNLKKNYWQQVAEAVEQQKDRLLAMLQTKFPNLTPAQHHQLFTAMVDLELQLSSQSIKLPNVFKFLGTFKINPQDSAAHTLDRFKRELTDYAHKSANTIKNKGKTPEQMAEMTRQELRKRLPEESPETIEHLLKQIQQGARINDVVNAYLSQKKSIGAEDRVVAKRSNLEMIEIKGWREGPMEKHIDSGKGLQSCHPLFKGTKWCVRFKEYFDDYTATSPLYLVREGGKPLVLGHKGSNWLDVNDEPPDPTMMEKLAPLVFNSGIQDVATKVVIYLPKPVEDVEEYLSNELHQARLEQGHSYSNRYAKNLRNQLLGTDYMLFDSKTKTIQVTKYDWLDETLKTLKGIGENQIEVDYASIEEWIDESSYENLGSIEDLVDNLDNKTEDLIINVLNKRYKENGIEIDGWEDMELAKALDHDDELKDTLRNAAIDATKYETMNNVIRNLKKDLKDGDDRGFWVDVDTWTLCIKSDKVNEWIKREVAPSGDPEDRAIIRHMNFKIPHPEVQFDFSSKHYNERVKELISENRL